MVQNGGKVVVLGRISEVGTSALRDEGFEVTERPNDPPDLLDIVADADAIVVRMTLIDERLLEAAPKLKFVARHGVGYDTVDVDALTSRGIPLAITGDVNSGAVAEHTITLMLALAKRVVAYDRAIRFGNFGIRDTFSATELAGKTLLMVGFGRIGRKVAKLAEAFGMEVLVHDPFVPAEVIRGAGYDARDDLVTALQVADWVTLHAPKSPGGGALIGAKELAHMKPQARLVNVARGGMIDETALIEALDSGRLAGAALDVFVAEPIPADSRLAQHTATLLTPHSAAFTAECSRRKALACASNVSSFFSGKLDRTVVINPEVLKSNDQT